MSPRENEISTLKLNYTSKDTVNRISQISSKEISFPRLCLSETKPVKLNLGSIEKEIKVNWSKNTKAVKNNKIKEDNLIIVKESKENKEIKVVHNNENKTTKEITKPNNQEIKENNKVTESDPIKDFFMLTFQSIKLNSEHFEIFQSV